MIIQIKNLLLRTVIGFQDWEREKPQDILINILIEAPDSKAIRSDRVEDTIDYKIITKKVIAEVEKTRFLLIERLANFILDLIMADKRIRRAVVEVDKPHALRFAQSVSVKLERRR
jgi:D-erythro-7,8-dihydroneopterin triphosphate epimerase